MFTQEAAAAAADVARLESRGGMVLVLVLARGESVAIEVFGAVRKNEGRAAKGWRAHPIDNLAAHQRPLGLTGRR